MSNTGTFKPLCVNGHLRTITSISTNGTCKECTREEAKSAKRWLARSPKNKKYQQKYHSKYHLKKTFGITIEEYNALLEKQSGSCALCNTPQKDLKRKLAVDHNHKTGEIRGLLCNRCNSMVVNVVENYSNLIEPAKLYLNRGK